MFRSALLAALLLAGSAAAQPPTDAAAAGQPSAGARERMAQFRQVCRPEIERLCGSAGQERGARRQCLQANASKLSEPCQAALAQMRAWRREHLGRARGEGAQPPSEGPQP
jgi:hypothetical protein